MTYSFKRAEVSNPVYFYDSRSMPFDINIIDVI